MFKIVSYVLFNVMMISSHVYANQDQQTSIDAPFQITKQKYRKLPLGGSIDVSNLNEEEKIELEEIIAEQEVMRKQLEAAILSLAHQTRIKH